MDYDDENMSNDDSMVPILWQNHPILYTNWSAMLRFFVLVLFGGSLGQGPYLARIVCWLSSTH